jgi:cytidylate kinase
LHLAIHNFNADLLGLDYEKKGLVIAIDGPSGAGKSTTARLLAEHLGYVYIDTGAMYRAVGWKAKREGIDPADEEKLEDLCRRTEVTIKQTTAIRDSTWTDRM